METRRTGNKKTVSARQITGWSGWVPRCPTKRNSKKVLNNLTRETVYAERDRFSQSTLNLVSVFVSEIQASLSEHWSTLERYEILRVLDALNHYGK